MTSGQSAYAMHKRKAGMTEIEYKDHAIKGLNRDLAFVERERDALLLQVSQLTLALAEAKAATDEVVERHTLLTINRGRKEGGV